jgi:hypothetical protein
MKKKRGRKYWEGDEVRKIFFVIKFEFTFFGRKFEIFFEYKL